MEMTNSRECFKAYVDHYFKRVGTPEFESFYSSDEDCFDLIIDIGLCVWSTRDTVSEMELILKAKTISYYAFTLN